MNPETILNFVKQKGYNTQKEIESNFSDKNQNIINMQLEYLVKNKMLGKIAFSSYDEHGILYYVIYYKEG